MWLDTKKPCLFVLKLLDGTLISFKRLLPLPAFMIELTHISSWTKASLISGIAILAIYTNLTMAEQLYKWVDKQGNVHYSDKIPVEQVDNSHSVLNEQGLTLKEINRAETEAEIKKHQEEQARADNAQSERMKAEMIRKRRDENLLQTFTSEQDIIIARDNRLAAFDLSLNLATRKLTDLQEKLNIVESSLERLSKNDGQEPPKNLVERRDILQKSIDKHTRIHDDTLKERNKWELRFKEDLQRFRELKSASAK